MRRTLVDRAGTGSGVAAPDGGNDARTDRSTARGAAFDASASPEVDDGRDIFGDAGLGRVDDGREIGLLPRRAEHGGGGGEPT
jgi:hypothetical protein